MKKTLLYFLLFITINSARAQFGYEICIVAINDEERPVEGVAIRPYFDSTVYYTNAEGKLMLNFPNNKDWLGYYSRKQVIDVGSRDMLRKKG